MNATFPLGFSWPTALYLVLYVATLAVHVVFMNYVVAGAGWLAVTGMSGKCNGDGATVRDVLRDWLPFALGAAITAGVAPILFIQILYHERFYTANLLLFHRWMAIVPVLIVGFYLLYVLKAKAAGRWPAWLRSGVAVVAFACFAFVAYSWTENHLLSVKSPVEWGAFYGERRVSHFEPALVPRLGMWFIGSVPTMAMLALWQLWFAQRDGRDVAPGQVRALALAALVAMGAAVICAGWYATMEPTVWKAASSPLASSYRHIATVGAMAQAAGFGALLRAGAIRAGQLVLTTVGVLVTILGMTVVREAIRLHSVDITALYDAHAQASRVGGLRVFLAFFLINAALIAWAILLVRRGQRMNRSD